MTNDPLTINSVPIIYRSWLPTDGDGADTIYVRNARPDDDPADVIFLPRRTDEQAKSR